MSRAQGKGSRWLGLWLAIILAGFPGVAWGQSLQGYLIEGPQENYNVHLFSQRMAERVS